MMRILLLDATSVLKTIGSVLVALVTLMVMILVHEAGHYAVGKALKFKINEFAIGFGPAIFKKKRKNGELFSIRCIPLGGFCAFEGEDAESEVEGAFTNQAPWKRILVLLAGVTFNTLSAFIVLAIAFMSYGYALPTVTGLNEPVTASNVVQLQQGDILYKVNGKRVYTLQDFNIASILSEVEGDTVEVVVLRNVKENKGPKGSIIYSGGEQVTVTTPLADFVSKGVEGEEDIVYRGLGILTTGSAYRLGLFRAFGYAVVYCAQIVVFLFQTIGGLFTGLVAIKGAVGGPITTIGVVANSVSNTGFKGVLMLLGMMSANLAVMNALPLPALDGSRVVFTIIEWIVRKPLNRKVEAIIHTVGIIILFGLTIAFDIMNLGMIANLF